MIWQRVSTLVAPWVLILAGSLMAIAAWWGFAYVEPPFHVPTTITASLALLAFVLPMHLFVRQRSSSEQMSSELQRMIEEPSCLDFQTGQVAMYGEVRRARQTGRPLTLLAIAPQRDERHTRFASLLVRPRRSAQRRLRSRSLAAVLGKYLGAEDLVVQRNGHFLALLVTADENQSAWIEQEMALATQHELGIRLRTSKATFPDQQVTLSGLLDHAESGLRRPRAARREPSTNGLAPAEQPCHSTTIRRPK